MGTDEQLLTSSRRERENSAGRQRIDSLQAIRAVAFLGIFTSHCAASDLGAWGVSVFIILSGFLMMVSYYDKPLKTSLKSNFAFSGQKLNKLYGLHIFTMIAAIPLSLLSLIGGLSFKVLLFLFAQIILNIFMIQSWVPNSQFYFSLNGVAWYLPVCLFIYFMFPFIEDWLKRQTKIKTVVFAGVAIYLIQIIVAIILNPLPILSGISDNFIKWVTYICPLFRCGDFFIGCCAGYCFKRLKSDDINLVTATMAEIVIALLIILCNIIFSRKSGFLGNEPINYTLLYTPTSVLLVYFFAMEKGLLSKIITNKPLIWLGNISAYAFLIHQVIIRYISMILNMLWNITLSPWLMVAVALVTTILCTEIWIKYLSKRIDQHIYFWHSCNS